MTPGRAWMPVSPAVLRAAAGTTLAARPSRKPALAQEHSATSRAAAGRIEPSRISLQGKVYLAIAMAPDGLTDEEGINRTGIPASTYRPRRVELVEANRVLDSGRTRLTRSRRAAVVWVAR